MNICKRPRNTSFDTTLLVGRRSFLSNSPRSLRRYGLVIAALFASALVVATLLHSGAATACSATPDPAQGTDTQTVTIPQTGTYYLWSRLLVPDTTNNSYYLQVDGGCAVNVGNSASIPANSWTWVNYQDGSASSVTSMSLTAGAHQVVMTGKGVDVGVDRVLFLGSSSCVPTGTGDNCTPAPDTIPPTVSIATPSSGATVSGTTTVSANASDNGGGDALTSVQFKLDGSNLGSPITTSPYSYSWNTVGVSNGSHTLTAVASDAAGNTATATSVSVTVNNSSGSSLVPVYRFWSPHFGNDHFFTTSSTEKAAVTADPNWIYEGVGFKVPSSCTGAATSVYRYWSPVYGKHFYTASVAEKNILASNPNWTLEGVGFCADTTQASGDQPVYRFWSPAFSNAHFYTESQSEKTTLSTDPNWISEGIGWYGQ